MSIIIIVHSRFGIQLLNWCMRKQLTLFLALLNLVCIAQQWTTNYDSLALQGDSNYVIYKDGLLGIATYEGAVVLAPQYEEIKKYYGEEAMYYGFGERGYCVAKQNGKWGMVNRDGAITLPFKYDGVGSGYMDEMDAIWEDRVGIVGIMKKGKWGWIDLQWGHIVKPKYWGIGEYGEAILEHEYFVLIPSSEDDHYKIATSDGAVQEFIYALDGCHFGDYLLAHKNGRPGMYNATGELVVPHEYDTIIPWRDEETKEIFVFEVHDDGNRRLYSINGTLLPENYDSFTTDDEGTYLSWTTEGKVGIMDRAGNILVPAEYDRYQAHYFRDEHINRVISPEGLITLQKDGQWGVLNTNGEVITPFEYDQIGEHWRPLVEKGLIYLKKDGLAGFADTTGRVILEPTYGRLDFGEGGLDVSDCGWIIIASDYVWADSVEVGVININGEQIIPLHQKDSNESIYPYDCLWGMKQGGYFGVIGADGNAIIPFEYDSIEFILEDLVSAKVLYIHALKGEEVIKFNTNGEVIE